MTAEPSYRGSELHIHISGALSASLVPWWIHWLRHTSPQVTVNASISEAAARFVSPLAIRELCNGEVWIDHWTEPDLPRSWRDGIAGESECILMFPASLDSLMRLAQGRTDSPAFMMLQATRLPILLASVAPVENPITEHWIDMLTMRPNVRFVPETVGFRADSRTPQSTGFNLPAALDLANAMIDAGE